ncbi:MAG TPA: dTDP-4-dehydrorhamnose 3,5-epimerase [Solirubrobacteraceae bacterium]|nr:dTDP-4-dehydrorhamnose 3,5-epimerase [Solirubrobacteraceae bacterium]
MIFRATPIPGLVVVEPERAADERGYFTRTYSASEFRDHGLEPAIAQCSTSFNTRAGTLRGMHYQAAPHAEAKLVRCTRGAIYDVALDLRAESPTYLSWHAVELSDENGLALFVPAGCAHGFQTLRDRSEVHYQISVAYEPSAARGVRWNDTAFAIDWPDPPDGERTMSERDATFPDYLP